MEWVIWQSTLRYFVAFEASQNNVIAKAFKKSTKSPIIILPSYESRVRITDILHVCMAYISMHDMQGYLFSFISKSITYKL